MVRQDSIEFDEEELLWGSCAGLIQDLFERFNSVDGRLAQIIILSQFPRHCFRGMYIFIYVYPLICSDK